MVVVGVGVVAAAAVVVVVMVVVLVVVESLLLAMWSGFHLLYLLSNALSLWSFVVVPWL